MTQMPSVDLGRCARCGTPRAHSNPAALGGACPGCLLSAARAVIFSPPEGGSILSEPPPPRTLGDYELIREIARGGMGIVWLAVQRSLGRYVAIKLLPAGRSCDPVRLTRFRSEASMAARLQHPQIVAIHEIGDQAGVPYYSMDYVPGQDLGTLARRRPLPHKDAAALVRTVSLAIQYAHDQGILHRDLKPSNVLVTPSGEPRVTDFGLAKLIEPEGDLTQSGEILGSPCFMAPEQVAARKRCIDTRTDVYGLGGLLYFSLTGQPPFSGESISAILQSVLHAEPVAPRRLNPEIPAELEQIVMRCLAKDPANRYSSAAILASELERAIRGQPLQTPALGRVLRFQRWAIREPGLAFLGTASVLLLGTLLVGWVLFANHQEDARRLDANRRSELEVNRYIADVSLAGRALKEGDLRTASRLLDGIAPAQGAPDRRGIEWHLLHRQCGGNSERTCWEGTEPVLDALPSADHRQVILVTSSRIRVVPADGGFAISEYSLPGPVSRRRLTASSTHGTVWVGDDLGLHRVSLTTGFVETVLKQPVGGVVVRPDGELLVVEFPGDGAGARLAVLGSNDRRVRFEVPVAGPAKTVWAVDGSLTWMDSLGTLSRWTPEGGVVVNEGPVLEAPALATAVSGDLRRRAIVTRDGLLRVEDLSNGTVELREQLDRWVGVQLYLSPEGERLVQVGGGGDQRLILRESSDWGTKRYLQGHTDRVGNLRFLPAHQGLLSCSADGSVRAWRWEGVQVAGAWKDIPAANQVGDPVFAPDGKWMSVGFGESPHGFSKVWAVADPFAPPIRLPGRTIAFAPEGRTTLQWRESGLIEVWDYGAGQRVSAFQLNPLPSGIPDQVSEDGSFFACLGRDAHLRIFHGNHGRELPGPVAKVRLFRVAPDGHSIAFAMPGGVGVFKPGSGDQYQFVMGEPTTLAVSRDSRYVAAGFGTGRMVVHDVQERRTVADVEAQPTPITAMSFVADCRTLLTGGEDGELRFWNVPGWREVARLQLPGPIRSLIGRPEHRAVLAASGQELRLLGTGQLGPSGREVRFEGGFWEDPLRISRMLASRIHEPLPVTTLMR